MNEIEKAKTQNTDQEDASQEEVSENKLEDQQNTWDEKSSNEPVLDDLVTSTLDDVKSNELEVEKQKRPESFEEEPEPEQISDDEAISIIESLLFISDRPVGMSVFKTAFENTNIDNKKIKELITELQSDMANLRRGVSLEEVNGAYQVRTKIDNQNFIKKIIKTKTFKLTGPSLEALSVVAYKQPCVKSDVDEVRGVESGHLVRALMDKGLVAFAGKSELPGKPMLYKTTRKFLEIFGLRNIKELPSLSEMEDLLPDGIGDDEEKESLGELAEKMSENYEGNYSVAEDELGKITGQLAGISTNTEFFEEEKRKQKEKAQNERAKSIQEALDLGEEVKDKDKKWLERFEAKQAEKTEQEDQESKEQQTQITTENAAKKDVNSEPLVAKKDNEPQESDKTKLETKEIQTDAQDLDTLQDTKSSEDTEDEEKAKSIDPLDSL